MEKHKTSSFFGHRNVKSSHKLNQTLKDTIENLIIYCNVSIFLFGSRSNFDYICYSVVTELKTKYPIIKRVFYTCKSEYCIIESERKKLERDYSNVVNQKIHLQGFEEEFEHKTKYSAGKASYVERNYAMINNSDYCIFFYDKNYLPEIRKYSKRSIGYYQPKSGTALAYKYAKQKKKITINLLHNKTQKN